MYDYERILIADLSEKNGMLEYQLGQERANYDTLKSLVVNMMKDIRELNKRPSDILDEFSDDLAQYCGIYIDEEIKND